MSLLPTGSAIAGALDVRLVFGPGAPSPGAATPGHQDQSMMPRKESRGTVVPSSNDCSICLDEGPRYGSRAARFCIAAGVTRFGLADAFFFARFFGAAM